jgi:SynChlorMet cassette protein ScmC
MSKRKQGPGKSDFSYSLELADGTVWELCGDEAVSDWLGELARIMGLTRVLKRPTHTIYFHGVKDLTSPFQWRPYPITSGENPWKHFKAGAIQQVWRHAHVREIHVELSEAFLDHREIRYINMWSALREIHRHALLNGGTPVHAALVSLKGKGVLIAGPGGTGKSTCYEHLPDYWDRLCDDQALVLRMKDGHFRVHPFPTWSDHLWRESEKRWLVERSVPLKAAFFLEQAPRDEVLPLKNLSEAVLKYLESAKQMWRPVWAKVEKGEKSIQSVMLFDNITRMVHAVPAYRLRARVDGEFWKKMESVPF